MLMFLVPLKPRRASFDWERVMHLLNGTLASLFNQTCDDFRVTLAVHERPDLTTPTDERLEIVEVGYPAPQRPPDNDQARNTDKAHKLRYAAHAAARYQPDYYMVVDADDRVSNRLAAHCQNNPKSNGWILKQGYEWPLGSRYILRDNAYNCGTNAILHAHHVEPPVSPVAGGQDRCVLLTAGHTNIERTMAEHGAPLEPLPFRGGVYVTANGENFYAYNRQTHWYGLWHFAQRLTRRQRLTRSLRQEYALLP